MTAVHNSRIRYAILELVHQQETNSKESALLYAAITVPGNEDCWIDVLLGQLNFGYPHRENPVDFLTQRGVLPLAGLAVTDFEPNRYATLDYQPCHIDDAIRFVRELLSSVHSLPPDYSVDIQVQHLRGDPKATSQHDWYRAMPSPWPSGTARTSANGGNNPRETWREPALNTDLWELESAEDRHHRSPSTFWIPSLDERTSLDLGDLAQLMFRLEDLDDPGDVAVERMWVLVTTKQPDGRLLGRLINQPGSVDSRQHYLTIGSEVPFQVKHIMNIHRLDQSDIDDFLANALLRKWE